MGKFMCAVWCKFFSGGSLLYYRVFGEFFIFRKKMRFIQGVEHNNAIVEFLINSLSFNAVSMMNWIDIRLPLGCISCEINSKRYIQMSKDCFPWKWNGKKCLLFNNITNIIHIHVLIYRRCLHGTPYIVCLLFNVHVQLSTTPRHALATRVCWMLMTPICSAEVIKNPMCGVCVDKQHKSILIFLLTSPTRLEKKI